jgi:hypothetical protein
VTSKKAPDPPAKITNPPAKITNETDVELYYPTLGVALQPGESVTLGPTDKE